MALDVLTIRRYLGALALDESAPQTWQVFADRKGANVRPEHRHATFRDALPWLHASQERGAGVFLTVNATNGGRRAADVTAVRALFVDVDTPQPEPRWHLEPSCVVESSPGKWHAYWNVADEMPLDAFAAAQQRIALHYDGDAACKDLSRVLRVPGTQHLKGEPRPVRLHHCAIWGVYGSAQVLESLPELPKAPERRGPSPEALAAARRWTSKHGERQEIDPTTLRLSDLFTDLGMSLGVYRGPGLAVVCPWANEHSSDTAQTATMVWDGDGAQLAGFKCLHAHCADRKLSDVMRMFSAHLDAYAQTRAAPSRLAEIVADRLSVLDHF